MRCYLKFFLPAFLLSLSLTAEAQQRTEKLSLDAGWLFHLGDIALPELKNHGETYQAAKAGAARGAAGNEFDDSEWRNLRLPHDWAMEENVDSTASLSQGYRDRGIGWYRRRFVLNESDKGKHIELQFGGIATRATVWVNGHEVYHSYSAYSAINIDISAIAEYGKAVNVIAIRVDANAMEGWWYEGAGIYRKTCLVKRAPLHITTDGVYANPIKNARGEWLIPAEVTLENIGSKTAAGIVQVQLLNPQGKPIAQQKLPVSLSALQHKKVSLMLQVPNPQLWDIENPVLYTVKTKLTGQNSVDDVITRCGFRTIRFDADKGFYLNGKSLKIKGVCNHIDHAGVGTAMPDALWAFRLEKIKAMGANAYRCAHNAPDPKVLELCDSLGILVMDENRNFNTSPSYLAQLEWLVRRDRNHPSVILWSVFNEEPIQGTAMGYEMVRRMASTVKKLDVTRPVTAAMNGGFFEPINVSQAVDVMGFNYEISSYDKFHQQNPHRPVISSEDASGVMIRGEYSTDFAKHLLSSYDTEAPPWGATHRASWKAIAERPWMGGCFVWTGFDYHGEPTPFAWPTVNSSFGIMDLCGFPKAAYYLRQAQWLDRQNILHLVPHWNWPADSIGKPIKVMALSNADKIALYLNGKLIAEKQNNRYEMIDWLVPYQPGKLEAVGYKNNKAVSRFEVNTTDKPVRLKLTAYQTTLANDGVDVTPITIEALDQNGRHVPTANFNVNLTIDPSGQIIGVGNGNPNSHQPEKGNQVYLFNGLAQVIVQTIAGGKGTVSLSASASGYADQTVTIALKEVKPISEIAAVPNVLHINHWRRSPFFVNAPSAAIKPADNDMNSWTQVQPGSLQVVTNDVYAVYRSQWRPYAKQQKNGGTVIFKQLTGKAEIWLDGIKIASKNNEEPVDFSAKFSAGNHVRELSVVLHGNKKIGIGGNVEVY